MICVGCLMRFDQIMISQFQLRPKQNDKYPTNAHVAGWGGGGVGGGGEYAGLELTETLIKKVILPGKLSILCDV